MDGGGGRSLRVLMSLKMVIPVRGFGRSPTDIHSGREEKKRKEIEKWGTEERCIRGNWREVIVMEGGRVGTGNS